MGFVYTFGICSKGKRLVSVAFWFLLRNLKFKRSAMVGQWVIISIIHCHQPT